MNGQGDQSTHDSMEALSTLASSTLEIGSHLPIHGKLPPKQIPKSVQERKQQLIEGGRAEFAKLLQCPNLWPFAWPQGKDKWMSIIEREMGGQLEESLNQISIHDEKQKDEVFDEIRKYFMSKFELSSEDLQANDQSQNPLWGLYIQEVYPGQLGSKLQAHIMGLERTVSTKMLDNFPLSLPLSTSDGLTSNTLHIERITERKTSKRERLKDALHFKETDAPEVETDTIFQCAIHEIPFKQGLLIDLPGGQKLQLKLKVQQPSLGLETAKMMHSLGNITSLFRPFFSDLQWKIADANAKLLKFATAKEVPNEVLVIDSVTKVLGHVQDLDENLLEAFYHYCLIQLVHFRVKSSVNLDRYRNIVHVLCEMPMKNLKDDLASKLEQCLINDCNTNEAGVLADKLDQYDASIEWICQEFGSFGLNAWCPVWADLIFDKLIPKLKSLSSIPDDLEISKLSFQMYIRLKNISKYRSATSDSDELLKNCFQHCLRDWTEITTRIVKEKVSKVLAANLESHKGHKPVLKLNSIDDSFVVSEEDVENWKTSATCFYGIMHECLLEWQKTTWLEYGYLLLGSLQSVFQMYVKGMNEIILQDDVFTHVELTLALQSLHLAAHYEKDFLHHLNELSKGKGEGTNYTSGIDEIVETEANGFLLKFCEGQKYEFSSRIEKKRFYNADEDGNIKPLVRMDADEEKETLLGYLNILLKYFDTNLCIENEEHALSVKYQHGIKNKLFDVMEDEMVTYLDKKHRSPLPQIYQALEETKYFRCEVALEESPKIKNALKKQWCQKAANSELILDLYKSLDFNMGEKRGELSLSIEPENHFWTVSLKSIKDLKPRLGKEELDFSLALKLLPSGTQRFETEMFENLNDALFDLMDNVQYQFKFEGSSEDLLQIVLYDHSETRTNKIFRAIGVLPLEKMDGKVDLMSFPVRTSSSGADSPSLMDYPCWIELHSRHRKRPNKLVTSVKNYAGERRMADFRTADHKQQK